MNQKYTKHVYFSFFNPLKVTGELEIESLGWVYWGELGGGACHRAKPVSFVLNTPPFEVPWNNWLHGYAVISREHLRTRNTGHTCLVLATQLPGYAVVNTSPPPWNMLVGKKWLRGYASCQDHPSSLKLVRKEVKYVSREKSGYEATRLRHTFEDLFWSGGVFSSLSRIGVPFSCVVLLKVPMK